VWKLRGSKRIGGATCYAGGPKWFSDLEVCRNESSRSRFRSDWQIRARDTNDHCWAQRKSHRIDAFRTISVVIVALAHGELGNLKEAWRCIDEAATRIEKTRDAWYHSEVNRVAGEIALKSPASDAAKAETYFERALAVARKQQAKSWELRAAMSMARLWRDQGKRDEARDLLAPVYGWFTEGFDTLDLKEAKTLLDELVA